MAVAVFFPERNKTFVAPGCYDLHVWDGKSEIDGALWPLKISCWQFTQEELDELQRNGGKFYVQQFSVHQPPTGVHVAKPIELEGQPLSEEFPFP